MPDQMFYFLVAQVSRCWILFVRCWILSHKCVIFQPKTRDFNLDCPSNKLFHHTYVLFSHKLSLLSLVFTYLPHLYRSLRSLSLFYPLTSFAVYWYVRFAHSLSFYNGLRYGMLIPTNLFKRSTHVLHAYAIPFASLIPFIYWPPSNLIKRRAYVWYAHAIRSLRSLIYNIPWPINNLQKMCTCAREWTYFYYSHV